MLHDTIAAISTADVEAAISIVRMSGENAIEIANEIFSRNLLNVPSHTVHYGMIKDGDEIVDEVLVSVFRAPKTFTREDIVEINCHGGRIVTRRVLAMCLEHGARLARAGEFTQRAFLNGRIDLTQAEAIGDLIHADSQRSAKMAIGGVKGSVKGVIQPVIDELLELIATIEVNIDYPEYDDVEQLTDEIVLPRAEKMVSKMREIERKAESGRILKEGVKTVIAGKPNVGKSSLLNALLEEEKAIVTDIAGTTRDLVEGIIPLENVTLHLLDTAGIRETVDVVEQIGVEKAKSSADRADLILYVVDSSRELDENDSMIMEFIQDKKAIVLLNKMDLDTVVTVDDIKEQMKKYGDTEFAVIAISAKKEEGIEELEQVVKEMFYQGKISFNDEIYITNMRQKEALQEGYASLQQVEESIKNQMPEDFFSIDLMNAYEVLGQIIGESVEEDLVNKIFKEFCMGK